jgi:hypothetical protein
VGPSWSWPYGSWINNYLCYQCISPLKLRVRIPFVYSIGRCKSLCENNGNGTKLKLQYINALIKYEIKIRVRAMVFNTTFNNISVISWRSVLLVKDDQANLPLSEAKGRGGGGRSITRFFSQEKKIKFFTWKNSKFYEYTNGIRTRNFSGDMHW